MLFEHRHFYWTITSKKKTKPSTNSFNVEIFDFRHLLLYKYLVHISLWCEKSMGKWYIMCYTVNKRFSHVYRGGVRLLKWSCPWTTWLLYTCIHATFFLFFLGTSWANRIACLSAFQNSIGVYFVKINDVVMHARMPQYTNKIKWWWRRAIEKLQILGHDHYFLFFW